MANIEQESKIWKNLIILSVFFLIISLFFMYKETLVCNNNSCVRQNYYFYKSNDKFEINRNIEFEVEKGIRMSKNPCGNYRVEPFFSEPFCFSYTAENISKKIRSSNNNIKITHINYLSIVFYIVALFIFLGFRYMRKKYNILNNMAYMDIFILLDILLLLYIFLF